MTNALHSKKAPGPRGHFVLGHLREFLGDVLQLLMRASRQSGDVARFRLGPQVIHLVNHPDHIEYVLRSDHEKYDKRTRSVSRMRPVCGESLLTLDGDPWRRERRLVQPAFHPQRVAAFAPLMAEATAATLSRWKSHAESGEPL